MPSNFRSQDRQNSGDNVFRGISVRPDQASLLARFLRRARFLAAYEEGVYF